MTLPLFSALLYSFLYLFSLLFPALSPADDGTVPVPELRRLKLTSCPPELIDLDVEVDIDDLEDYVRVDVNVLYNSLAARLEKGYKLEELDLTDFELPTPDMYDLLSNVVDRLIGAP